MSDSTNTQQQKPFVIVGMSGGVDSSVAAFLLKQQGYRVEGLFMKNWEEDEDDTNCTATQDMVDAKTVAKQIGIKFHTINFSNEYWDRVFSHFLDEYRAGRTPNPDVLCNKEIKFKAFLDYALKLGADYIATGHFVKKKKSDINYYLLKGDDPNKDQSYFLYLLNQQQLEKSLFPVGELSKQEIRKIAEEQNFRNAKKKDSTGICFIGERKFKTFLNKYIPAQPGPIHSIEGKKLGSHDGLMFYTIGQREGLGIGGLKDQSEEPWYVVDKDLKNNLLIVAQGKNHSALFKQTLQADQLHWITDQPSQLPFNCSAKIRYRQQDQPCVITNISDGIATIHFNEPQRAVTPGQSIVFYLGYVCLGGGIIRNAT